MSRKNLFKCSPKTRSPLWMAILQDQNEQAEKLMISGADTNEPFDDTIEDHYNMDYEDCKTMLHVSLMRKNMNLVEALVKHKADPNARDRCGDSVLHFAIMIGCPAETLQMLIEHNADINQLNDTNDTPLHVAIYNGNETLVKAIIERGADVTVRGDYDENFLHCAVVAEVENLQIVQLLVEALVPIDGTDSIARCTPLHLAIIKGKELVARLLLERGASVYRKTVEGRSPLHLAILYRRSVSLIEDLIESGADVIGMVHSIGTKFLSVKGKHPNAARALLKYLAISKVPKFSSPNVDCDIPAESRPFYEQCLREVERMKKKKFFNDITFYHIVSNNRIRTAALLENESLVSALASMDYDELFPLYKSVIDLKRRKAQNRKEIFV